MKIKTQVSTKYRCQTPSMGVTMVLLLPFVAAFIIVTSSVVKQPYGVDRPLKDLYAGSDAQLRQWMNEVSGMDESFCSRVFEKVYSGEWDDPNAGKLLYRRINSEPFFYVSVHNEKYDGLRYRFVYNGGNYYENEVIKRFEYILRENSRDIDYNNTRGLPLVIDVGGNIGYYTILSAARRHAVVTFEINPANIIRICESLHLNMPSIFGFSRLPYSMYVALNQLGVSNSSGREQQVAVHINPGMTSLDRNIQENKSHGITGRTFTARTITLDDFATERNWFSRSDMNFSILKIDTEGHELQIIIGAERLIRSRRVKNILLEYRVHCRDVVNILLDAGYVVVARMAMLSREESIDFLDAETDRLRNSTSPGPCSDLWFRLESLRLIS